MTITTSQILRSMRRAYATRSHTPSFEPTTEVSAEHEKAEPIQPHVSLLTQRLRKRPQVRLDGTAGPFFRHAHQKHLLVDLLFHERLLCHGNRGWQRAKTISSPISVFAVNYSVL